MTQAVLKTEVTEMPIPSGIKRDSREKLAAGLRETLSLHYRLLLDTQILHWNVSGPLFFSVHNLTEKQYNKTFSAIDDIAERIRALGLPAPRSIAELMGDRDEGQKREFGSLNRQIDALIERNEMCAGQMRDLVAYAEQAKDLKTADLLTDRIGDLEEVVWMLRATITDNA